MNDKITHQTVTDHFRLCPRCGAAHPVIRADRELRCADCGFRFFFNVAAAAGAFVLQEGRLALCVRARDPGRGQLDVPGGFIEFDESLEAGLTREIEEELGIQVEELRYLMSAPNTYCFEGVEYRTSDVFFVTIVSPHVQLVPRDDVADIQWFDPLRVDPSLFAFDSTRTAYLRFRADLESGVSEDKVTRFA